MVYLIISKGKLYVNAVSISAERQLFSFLATFADELAGFFLSNKNKNTGRLYYSSNHDNMYTFESRNKFTEPL